MLFVSVREDGQELYRLDIEESLRTAGLLTADKPCAVVVVDPKASEEYPICETCAGWRDRTS